MIRVIRVAALCGALLSAHTERAAAQNLFEVEVFPDEILDRGQTELELHDVFMPSGTRLPDAMLDPSTHVHVSFEVSHGWSDRFETGMFVETSPVNGDAHAALTGFHVRPKFRVLESSRFPVHMSVSAEYAFLKAPGEATFRQALAITPIFEQHVRRFEMSLNPGIAIGLSRPDPGQVVFEPSAKVATRVSQIAWVGVEYYAETGPIKHFDPLAEQHHLIFPTLDIRTPHSWEWNIAIGRGLTGGSEQWVFKSILAYVFPHLHHEEADRGRFWGGLPTN